MGKHPDIDAVISELRRAHPEIAVERLAVRHPGADDDGLWFFTHPGARGEVQVESSTGAAPFLVESDDDPPGTARTVGEAVALVATRLGLRDAAGGAGSRPAG